MNERGSALVGTLIVASLVLACVVGYQKATSYNVKGSVARIERGRALFYAETGVAQASDFLRTPGWATSLPPGGRHTHHATMARGRVAVDMARNLHDPSLVELYATAYYYIPGTRTVDPSNGRRATMAAITAKVRARSVGDYFAVAPSVLQIAYGSNLGNASVYARHLVFLPANGSTALPTRVQNAFYSGTVQIPPNTVVFNSSPWQPQQLKYEPNLVNFSSTLRTLYQKWAGSDVIPAGTTLTSLSAPGNTYGIYFSPGDVYLSGATLPIHDNIILYSTGTVYIECRVNANGGWLAVIAEKDIVISKSAPAVMRLEATLVAGESIYAEDRTGFGTISFNFTGGFQAQGGANFSSAWSDRVYSYQPPPATMPLPFFLSTEEYRVTHGKYSG